MKNYKGNHNLKSGTPIGTRAGSPSKQYPEEIQKYILDNYKGVGHKDMADQLNSLFGTKYNQVNIKSYYANHKLDSGLKGRFQKGHVPANKGQRGICYEGCKPTQFKSGQMPHNYRPIGSERINVDGYTEVKIADPKKWKAKHVIVWEEANGPVPKNHVIIFADGNKRNFDLNNLLMLSRQQLVRMNQNHLIQPNAELTKTGVIIANIGIKIGERKKKNKGAKSCRN